MESIGRYRIVGELGRGAMGVVYHAIDPTIGRPVAIKTIRIRDIDNEGERERLRERLFREARSAGVLSHPNIVTIYDMDEADGLAYIAMAYVNGPTLEKILASVQPLSGANMLRILRQTALALDYAHGKGIIHRDIKPANIMTDEDGAVKVTDFGIAKIASGGHSTGTRGIAGTPNYMSPEHVQGLEVDGRSDQFSLAVIAYEILTGERPFTGEHLSTVIFKIVGEEQQPAHRINGTLTQQIDDVLRKGLAKKPEDRYVNCSALVGALEMACAESRGWQTLPAGAAAAMPTLAIERPAAVPEQQKEPDFDRPGIVATGSPRRAWRLGTALIGITAVLATVGYFAWRSGEFPVNSAGPTVTQVAENAKPAETSSEPTEETTPASRKAADATDADALDSTPQASADPAELSAGAGNAGAAVPAAEAPANQMLAKPSPVVPAPLIETEPGIRETVRIPPANPQDVWVTSNPPGAKAVMDGEVSRGCATPCMLQATPGVHHLTVAQEGFQMEYREIHVGDGASEIPMIALRQPTGTLMLMTNPAGASIWINGKMLEQKTPAQLSLTPGSYTVTVAKDGRSETQNIQLHESPLYLRIPLSQ
jgi:tRNA A-37 threonylcarbamoyl transferase component Bud32